MNIYIIDSKAYVCVCLQMHRLKRRNVRNSSYNTFVFDIYICTYVFLFIYIYNYICTQFAYKHIASFTHIHIKQTNVCLYISRY